MGQLRCDLENTLSEFVCLIVEGKSGYPRARFIPQIEDTSRIDPLLLPSTVEKMRIFQPQPVGRDNEMIIDHMTKQKIVNREEERR